MRNRTPVPSQLIAVAMLTLSLSGSWSASASSPSTPCQDESSWLVNSHEILTPETGERTVRRAIDLPSAGVLILEVSNPQLNEGKAWIEARRSGCASSNSSQALHPRLLYRQLDRRVVEVAEAGVLVLEAGWVDRDHWGAPLEVMAQFTPTLLPSANGSRRSSLFSEGARDEDGDGTGELDNEILPDGDGDGTGELDNEILPDGDGDGTGELDNEILPDGDGDGTGELDNEILPDGDGDGTGELDNEILPDGDGDGTGELDNEILPDGDGDGTGELDNEILPDGDGDGTGELDNEILPDGVTSSDRNLRGLGLGCSPLTRRGNSKGDSSLVDANGILHPQSLVFGSLASEEGSSSALWTFELDSPQALLVQVRADHPTTARVFDLLHREIRTMEFQQQDLSDNELLLPSGVYFLQLESEDDWANSYSMTVLSQPVLSQPAS